MLNSYTDSPLYPIANPDSIAIFGASNNPMRMGSMILYSLESLGYAGEIFPIHRSEKRVHDLQAYPSVLDLPRVPDLALIVLPTDIVTATLEECGRKGIRHAIIVSGGFREAGRQGAGQQAELQAIATRYGIRFLGPNCLGVANPHRRLNPTPMSFEGQPGFVGLASQSGSFITQMYNYLHRHGLGYSTAFSVGNEANIDIVDCLEYLGACPHTRVIALYIEGINRGRAFMQAARAIAPTKPIVALYAGGSEAGQRAGLSHTGAIAGPDELYAGALRQCGIIRAGSLTQLFDFCLALGQLPGPKGPGVIIQTHSGGPGATAADACSRAGLTLPALSKSTVASLEPLIPHTASLNNPVDITFSSNPLYDYNQIPDVLLQDENSDRLMLYVLSPYEMVVVMMERAGLVGEQARKEARRMIAINCESLVGLKNRSGRPVVGYSYRSLEEPLEKALLQNGVPVYPDPERAARSLAALRDYHRLRARLLAGKTVREASSQLISGG